VDKINAAPLSDPTHHPQLLSGEKKLAINCTSFHFFT